MNVTVNSQLLAAELRLLNRIVSTKPAIVILSYVLVRANEQLNFWATDLEVGLSCNCQAQVNEPGAVALPVAKLLALVEQFADEDVVIASEKQHVVVKCAAFKSRLQALPPDDFPAVPEVRGQSSVIDAGALMQLIARTRYAINVIASNFALNGALLTLTDQVAAMVATDAKRLALATVSRTGPDARVVVPAKVLDALVWHLDSDCELTVGDRHLFFASAGRLLISRTIDGDLFPKYERIIPRNNDLSLTVDRAALSAALRRVNLVSDKNCAVYFDVRPSQLMLSSSSAEVGSAEEVVQIGYDDRPLKICINGGYVLDFLNAAQGGTVTMTLKDEKSSALLMDGADHVAVIMLMRGN